MKIFKILFRYAQNNPLYDKTSGKIDIVYLEANSVEDAKKKYGYMGIIAVREVSIFEIMGGPYLGN